MSARLTIQLVRLDGFHLAEFHAPDGTVPAYTGLNRTKYGTTDLLRAMLAALVEHFRDDVPALEHIRATLEPADSEPGSSISDLNFPGGARGVDLGSRPAKAGECSAAGADAPPGDITQNSGNLLSSTVAN